MATVQDILDLLEGIAPLETQEEWDNAGLLAGDPAAKVTRVLVALDLTLEVVEEAERLGARAHRLHRRFAVKRAIRMAVAVCQNLIRQSRSSPI